MEEEWEMGGGGGEENVHIPGQEESKLWKWL